MDSKQDKAESIKLFFDQSLYDDMDKNLKKEFTKVVDEIVINHIIDDADHD